jgi:hypothetical protein
MYGTLFQYPIAIPIANPSIHRYRRYVLDQKLILKPFGSVWGTGSLAGDRWLKALPDKCFHDFRLNRLKPLLHKGFEGLSPLKRPVPGVDSTAPEDVCLSINLKSLLT